MKFYRSKFSSGFTIIELLIALAIVGILATVTIVLINPAEKLAATRDTSRKATVKQLVTSLEAYSITKCGATSCSGASYPTSTSSSGAISSRWASYVEGRGSTCGAGPCLPRYIAPMPPIPYVKAVEPCKGDATGSITTKDENGNTYTWFSESGFCYGVTDDGNKAIISTPLESDAEIKKCPSTGKAFVVWTSTGKNGTYCDQTGTIAGSTEFDSLTPLPTDEAPVATRNPNAPTSTPAPTESPITPTTSHSNCAVTTSPSALNLLANGKDIITATVTSGLNGATITQMNFGSYSTSFAMVSPDKDATPPYAITVTGLRTGNTAIWATAILSDGRECPASGTNDTDINIYMPPELLATNGNDCTDGSQCKSGYCVGTVCCASPACPDGGVCQTGGGSCAGGTCSPIANAAIATNPNNDCTGAYTSSGFSKRYRNMCNGIGACSNLDSAAMDCAGTCANYAENGHCINTNTTDFDTCDVVTNARVSSGGIGRCEAGVCKGQFRFTSQAAVSRGGHPPGPGLGWDYYTFQATIHNYGTTAKAVTVGAGQPGDYPPLPPTTTLNKTITSPVLQPGESWTYTYDDGPGHNVGVCNGSDACRPVSIMMRAVPAGQTNGNTYYDSIISITPGSSNASPWNLSGGAAVPKIDWNQIITNLGGTP